VCRFTAAGILETIAGAATVYGELLASLDAPEANMGPVFECIELARQEQACAD
jgi:hypothetical protein